MSKIINLTQSHEVPHFNGIVVIIFYYYSSLFFVGPPSEEMLPLPASMEQDQRCIVCKQRDREVLFEPCDHYVVCEECSKGLSQCPKCKTPILRKTLYGRRHALP